MKTRRHAIPASRFVVEYTTEGSPVFFVTSSVAKATVAEQIIHAGQTSSNCSCKHLSCKLLNSGLVRFIIVTRARYVYSRLFLGEH